MTLGEKIRILRNKFEWTLDDLQEATGLTHNYINHLENGYILNPPPQKLKRIASAFNVSVESLKEGITPENIRSILKRIRGLNEKDKKNLYRIVSLYVESKGV